MPQAIPERLTHGHVWIPSVTDPLRGLHSTYVGDSEKRRDTRDKGRNPLIPKSFGSSNGGRDRGAVPQRRRDTPGQSGKSGIMLVGRQSRVSRLEVKCAAAPPDIFTPRRVGLQSLALGVRAPGPSGESASRD